LKWTLLTESKKTFTIFPVFHFAFSLSMTPERKQFFIGISLAVLATFVWSGNFIVARGVHQSIPPVSLAFFRWATATVFIFPLALSSFRKHWSLIRQHRWYFFWTALSGITLFNTFVYVAGHYTEAVNLALIGTTSSPVMALILAAVFLNERIGWLRIIGLLTCIAGICYLLSKGSWERFVHFQFTTGDWWILIAALCFAVYNTFAKKKPKAVPPVFFLFVIFALGTILLIPFYAWEATHTQAVAWNMNLVFVILYLGLGTSVIAFLCWNAAIARLGAARTALFGNLIPIFSTLEAVWILKEEVTIIHLISGLLVIGGLVLANIQSTR
jgi:drug/metabolite transporter (DMT)-like permease